MKEETHNPWIDPELEARIVALLLGEASDFERDELNRLIQQRPELATLKEQLRSVHGLLLDVATGESVAEDEDWKLPAEKRNAVLAVISPVAKEQPAIQLANRPAVQQRSVKRGILWSFTKVAAALCVVGLFGGLAILAFYNRRLIVPGQVRQVASSEPATPDSTGGWAYSFGEGSAPPITLYSVDGARTVAADEKFFSTEGSTADAELDYQQNSRSALSAIRNTLDGKATPPSYPYYPLDDVEYATPEAEFQLSSATDTPLESGAWDVYVEPDAEGRVRFGAGVNSDAGVTGTIVVDERKSDIKRLAEGLRAAGSQSMVTKSSNGELSFPTFAADSGLPAAAEAAEPVRSTVSVPDGGTVLLGGIKRLDKGRSERVVSGESTVSSSMEFDGNGALGSGGETQDAAGTRTAALGLGNRPAEGSGAVTSPDFTAESLGSEGSAQGLAYSEKHQRLGEGKGLGFPSGLGDSQAAVENGDIGSRPVIPTLPEGTNFDAPDVVSADRRYVRLTPSPLFSGTGDVTTFSFNADAGGGQGGGGFGTNGTGSSDESGNTASAEYKPDAVAKGESNAWRKAAERAETKEMPESGISTRGVVQPDRRYSRIEVPIPMTGNAIGQPLGVLAGGQAEQDKHGAFEQDSEGDSGRGEQDRGKRRSLTYTAEDADRQNKLAELVEQFNDLIDEDRVQEAEVIAKQARELESDVARSMLLTSKFAWRVREHESIADLRERGVYNALTSVEGSGQLATSGRDHWYGHVPPMLVDNSDSMKTWEEKSPVPAGLNETTAEDEAYSTFSLHVSDVSFQLAQAALAQGEWPDPAKVRIEEFVNALDYGDPMPSQSEKIACRLEQSIHPFLQQRNLLRVSMRTAAAGRSSNTPLRLTFLLDNSGSMERSDRQQNVRRAFALLAQQLKPIDQVTLISFASQPRLLADKVSGAQSQQLVELIQNLPSQGGTNMEAALQLAFEKAQEQQVADAQNRIILLTDGAVNLGDANPENLSRMITTMRDAGIAFDAAGISAEGLNDEILEALTRQGDGRYYLLDSPEAADDGFVRQIAGALRPSAKNVKVQIEFNPKRVGRYKLLGFEKHRLNQEDFRNDTVDAAEMAAAEAGVAVYQFEAKPDGEGDVGSVSVRFRDLSTGQMIEDRWPIPYEADAPRPDQAAPSLRIATAAAMLAAKLRGGPLGETVDLKTLSDLIAGLPDRDRNANRVQQLQRMIQQARQVSGK